MLFLAIHVSAVDILSSSSQTVPGYKFDFEFDRKEHYEEHHMDEPLERFNLNGRYFLRTSN